MFIRKIKKDKKIYYMLVLVFQNRDQAEFHSLFIPEKLATYLIDCGITLKEKGDK